MCDDYDGLCHKLLKDKRRLLREKRWSRQMDEGDWWKPADWTPDDDE